MSSRTECIKHQAQSCLQLLEVGKHCCKKNISEQWKMFSSILNTVESLVESWQNSGDTQNTRRFSEGVWIHDLPGTEAGVTYNPLRTQVQISLTVTSKPVAIFAPISANLAMYFFY